MGFDEVINRKNTNSVKWDMNEEFFGREDVLAMWVADMDFKAPDEVLGAIKKRVEHGIFGYSYRSDSYLESIISWVKKRHGWNIKKEWITFSPGIVPALGVTVEAFSNIGDKILVQSPSYPPFKQTIKDNGRIVIDNKLIIKDNKYYMDLDKLHKQITIKDVSFTSNSGSGKLLKDAKVKMFMLCNPHNPVGRVWTKEELIKLGDVCLENNMIIVSDEIHSDIIYSDYKHIPIASLSKELEQNSITCIAPSKTFSLAGLSTSVIIIPNEKLRNEFNDILSKHRLDGGNVLGEVALEAAYTHGEKWLEDLLLYLEGNLNYLKDYLKANIPQIKPIDSEATYLVWLNCSGLKLKDRDLLDFFVEKAGIGVNPGSAFDEECLEYVRLNIACPRAILKTTLDNLKKAVDEVI